MTKPAGQGVREKIRFLLVACALVSATSCSSSILDPPVLIGVVTDSPGINFQNTENRRSGFEVDLYQWIGNMADPKFVPAEIDLVIEDRENALRTGRVDIVIASYSITDERERLIDFAGPYVVTKQGIMVHTDDQAVINRAEDLAGRSVCAQSGSTSVEELRRIPGVIVEEQVGLGQCIGLLREGKVRAVSTDQLLLHSYAQREPNSLKVLPVTFGALQKYGVGLPPSSSTENCEIMKERLQSFIINKAWDAAFEANFGGYLNKEDYRPAPGQLRACIDDDEV